MLPLQELLRGMLSIPHRQHTRLPLCEVMCALYTDRSKAMPRSYLLWAFWVMRHSIRSLISTKHRSAEHRAPTRQLIQDFSMTSATSLPPPTKPTPAATRQDDSPSTSRAADVRNVRATASKRSKCTFCPMCTSPAMPARASDTTKKRLRSSTKARAFRMYLT